MQKKNIVVVCGIKKNSIFLTKIDVLCRLDGKEDTCGIGGFEFVSHAMHVSKMCLKKSRQLENKIQTDRPPNELKYFLTKPSISITTDHS